MARWKAVSIVARYPKKPFADITDPKAQDTEKEPESRREVKAQKDTRRGLGSFLHGVFSSDPVPVSEDTVVEDSEAENALDIEEEEEVWEEQRSHSCSAVWSL
ncbi:hypothetical protein M408DRAFT_332947 [Serendipita vermifera MAFF 305830]|uniref:Uncharacterized protein n=1 Tax=Serendipita vermifera MAFF 305830 TaxID=933852 RepID=A0A0C3AQP1_SERVB|nr:hypothetical protein M408DRAFT_332947 [Serendipita vermifera MAFF 305830]